MNIKTSLKTLPVAGALALMLVLSPTVSYADKGERGDRGESGEHRGKAKGKDQREYYNRGIERRGYDKHARKYDRRRHRAEAYSQDRRHYDRHGYYYVPEVRTYVVPAPRQYVQDRYLDLRDLRFMIGLHTNNFDLTIRE